MLQVEQQFTEMLTPQDVAELTLRTGQIATEYLFGGEESNKFHLEAIGQGGVEGNTLPALPSMGGEEDLSDEGYNPENDNLRKKEA